MEKEKFEFGYLHPEVKVVSVSQRQVLCGSMDGLQNYSNDPEETIE